VNKLESPYPTLEDSNKMRPIKLSLLSSKNVSPHAIVIHALVVLFFLYIISPLEFTYFSASFAFVFVGGGIFVASSYFLCQLLGRGRDKYFICHGHQAFRVRKLFRLCFYLSSAGVFLRFLDFFVLRGYNFDEGFSSLRLSLQSITYAESSDVSRAGMISALGAFLYGFTYPLTIIIIMFYASIPSFYRKAGVLLAVVPIIDSLLNAGIMGAAFTLLYIAFALLYKWHTLNRKLNIKRVSYAALLMFALLWVGSFNYLNRIELMFGDIQTFFDYSTGIVRPGPYLFDLFEVPIIGSFAFAYYWISSYLLQGVAEFSFLFDNFNSDDFLYGAKQFFVVDKFLSIIGLTTFDAYQLTAVNPRPGRYQTVFGDIYMDFGVMGLLFQPLIAGLIFAYAYLSRGRGKIWALIMYPFFQASIVSGFLINSFSGSRFYFLAAGIVAIIFYYLSLGPRKRNFE